MPFEIEHKYLVNHDLWKNVVPSESKVVKQGYICSSPINSVRVRVLGDNAYITVKGKSTGATRKEFEYEIPVDEAEDMLALFCKDLISKTRHYVKVGSHTWEVDEFHGLNAGLIVAEIELSSEEEKYALPEWIDRDVTSDKRYSNANLVLKPFGTW